MTVKEVNEFLSCYGINPVTLEEIESDANLRMWLLMSLGVTEFTD